MKMKIESYLDSVSDNFKNLKIASSNIENAAKTTINALQNNNKII